MSKNVLGPNQASSIDTQKWHLFDHLLDAIKGVELTEFPHGELFEAAHKRFILLYGKTSRRHSTAIDETAERHTGEMLKELLKEKKKTHSASKSLQVVCNGI